MTTQVVDLGYTARKQFEPFHTRRERWACLVCHRRAGKTVACVMDLIDAALRCDKPNGRFGYVAPYYVQAKDVAFGYLKQFALRVPGATVNESELRVDFPHNGARIRLYGADSYDRMRGLYFDGIVMDEAGDMDPRAFPEVIRPALSDRRGWCVWIGTPKGRNDFWEIWTKANQSKDWFSLMLTADVSGLVADEELEDARKMMTPEQYAQEYLCSFEAAILGAYFGKEIADAERAGRICEVPYDPSAPVHTAWDLGMGDSTAIWFFQVVPGGVRFIDHYENHGHGLDHYAAVLAAKPYKYEHDWVPHDAKVRELGTGRTRIETLKELKRNPRLVPDHKIMDGINAARVGFPRFWFDEVKCRSGLEALRQYRTEFDEKAKVFKNTPRHDWTSHTADAFRYAAMAWRELVPEVKKEDAIKALIKPKTFNQVLEEYDAELSD